MLVVKSLELRDWRNFERRTIDFSNGLTVLHGRNATGKTNAVEALQTLTAGASFRHPKPSQLVREGADSARIDARIEGDGRVIDVTCKVMNGRRSFERNGKHCVAADLSETLMSVLFTPDDLSIIKRGASHRRNEIDDFGRQANRGYGRLLAAYTRAVEQRNRLLKEDYPDLSLLAAWDASVALGGASLLSARVRLFKRLATHIRQIYARIADGEELDCRYVSSLDDDVDFSEIPRDQIRDLFLQRLEERRADELRRQQTLVGPQRDDIVFEVGGRNARDFASQGQQRSIILAWKMAEVELSSEIVGTKPLLLLDDVMSELDEVRRAAMTGFVKDNIQTVITTANLGYFPQELLVGAEVVPIGQDL